MKFIPGHMTDFLNISFWCNFTISCHKIKSYFTISFFSWLPIMEKSIRLNMIRFYIWNRTSQVSIAEQLSDRVIHSKSWTRNLLEAKYQMKSSKRSSRLDLLELPLSTKFSWGKEKQCSVDMSADKMFPNAGKYGRGHEHQFFEKPRKWMRTCPPNTGEKWHCG